jgi:hypothetical protein
LGALRIDRRSRVFLARTSCTIPITTLATSTTPNRASAPGSMSRMRTSSVPMRALK